MKKNNVLKLLMIAFVVAIISTSLFYVLVVSKMSGTTGNFKKIVVAAKPLKPGAVIQSTDVKQIAWLGEKNPNGAFEDPSEVVGKTVFDTIDEEEPVLAARLASDRSGGGSGVPSGMRAVSVHVTDSTGVMSLLRTGQKVDVQVVTGRGNGSTSLRTALEDLKVLAVSYQTEQSSQGATLPVVTLLAKPWEADVLALADSGARVRLTLRNPLDDETRKRNSVSLDSVMRAGVAPEENSTHAAKSVSKSSNAGDQQ